MVKFIKYNFLENRLFADEEVLNSSFLKWLDRTGNAKIHGMTKKIPAKVFEDEREHLRIENPIFNNLKRKCGLVHCFVHGGKAVEAVLYLIFISSNIMQLFLVRRLRKYFATQREMVRLLLKGLYQLKYRAEFVFSSS